MHKRILEFSEPIASWDEALPLGNGQTGMLLWGGDRIKLSLDRVDIWDNRPAPETLTEEYTYETMAKAYKSGDKATLNRLFEDPYDYPVPTKLLAGRIELLPGTPVTSMSGFLDMETAEACVTLACGREKAELRTFIHAVNGIGYARIENGENLSMAVINPAYGLWKSEADDDIAFKSSGSLQDLKYPPAEKIADGYVEGFIQATRESFQYAVLVAKRIRGNVTDIVFNVAVSHDLSYDFKAEKEQLTAALENDYENERESHKAWWRDYYAGSRIELPDAAIMQMYDINNYLLACVSRKGCPPMPLQGVFTADNGRLAPWKGDYHNDLNTQMCYLSYLKANHLQAGESFLDFLTALTPYAKEYSASFFDAPDGLNLPGVMTIEGRPLGGWATYSMSITNAAWLCQCFSEYYDYTLDDEFLKSRMYPFLKGVGLCIKRWLADNGSGYLELPDSNSPEINDNWIEASFAKNTNYDISLCRFLFGRLADICEKCGDGQSRDMWSGILSGLRPLAIGPKGLKVNEDFDLEESHRHISHAMSVHPLRLIRYEGENKKVIDRTIEHMKKLGMYLWTGYTVAWFAEFFAIQGNGEAARHYLYSYAENYASPNGFHLNWDYKNRGISRDHGRPFTLEGNMIAMDAVQEMLLYCENGELRVFPAVPEQWAQDGAYFETLRAKGAVLVSSAIKNGKVRYIKLEAEKDVSVRVENPFDAVPEEWPESGIFNLRAGDIRILEK
ncbi:MAG: glycoside hydrolase family 95 protein [Oscillospiraceae bacterium]|nr:glycoside hydrolase family 95 protein [Oscillospiraceae bacterium]